ncbi:MAG: arginine--tRNA ligase [Candidatus Nanoarchaeia archaeon]|nr:arginine--tRNA ligase [Candidatus Nanoarchaeia archaeon]
MDFKEEVIKLLKTEVKDPVLEVPPNIDLGDYAFPCFALAKEQSKAPNIIAQELTKKLKPTKYIQEIKAIGPYVNFFINKEILTNQIIQEILTEKDNYGRSNIGKKKKYMIEFFEGNTHKAVHIGHVRNICIGCSVSKILEFAGYDVIKVNYQGDIGPHVATAIWGMKHFNEQPGENKAIFLGDMYARANQMAKDDIEIIKEIQEINKKIYEKDPELTKLWKETRQWSLDYFNGIYKEFGFKFDKLYFESQVEQDAVRLAKDLVKKKIAEISEGAIIVDLKEFNLGVAVLLTRFGTPVYHAKDLALAKLKAKDYKLDKSIHVVGKEQEFYFNQVFKIFELMKSPLKNKSYHLGYGLVMLPEGKMSSREGTVITYDDLINKLREETYNQTKNRHDWDESKLKEVSEKIAFSALRYSMLNKENNRTITFDWKNSLNFEGDTGPYIQYSYARANSILKKVDSKIKPNYELLKERSELILIGKLAKFPSIVKDSALGYRPDLIANYAYDLAQTFSDFYHNCQCISDNKELEATRLSLVKATKQVIKNSLNLLGIDVIEEM